MTNLNIFALSALLFVHLNNPATGKKAYLQKEVKRGEGKDAVTEMVDDTTKPIGLRMYTPGSTLYRKVHAESMTSMLKTGFKNLTGEMSIESEIENLAKTTYEFVNLGEEGTRKASVDEARELYSNPEYEGIFRQVKEEQGDLGNASRARSKA